MFLLLLIKKTKILNKLLCSISIANHIFPLAFTKVTQHKLAFSLAFCPPSQPYLHQLANTTTTLPRPLQTPKSPMYLTRPPLSIPGQLYNHKHHQHSHCRNSWYPYESVITPSPPLPHTTLAPVWPLCYSGSSFLSIHYDFACFF